MRSGLPHIRARALRPLGSSSRAEGSWIAPMDEPMPDAPPAGQEPLEAPLAAPRPEALQRDNVQPGMAASKGLKAPALPTPAEVAEHELTHMPAKAWCERCVRGRGRDDIHSKAHHVDQVAPVIEIYHFYLTEHQLVAAAVGSSVAVASSPAATAENEEQAQTKSTCLVAIYRSTGYLYGSVVEENGPKCARRGFHDELAARDWAQLVHPAERRRARAVRLASCRAR
jgi:hypothetical protein